MIMYLNHLKNKQIICGFILLAVNIVVLTLILVVNDLRDKLPHQDNILDGCYHIYIDAGSNIGNSIRKIFEPDYGMFVYHTHSRCYWFSVAGNTANLREYNLIGVLMGLAVYNR